MNVDFERLLPAGVRRLRAYDPGHDPGELRARLGLDRLVELGSNENPLGPSPLALAAISRHARDAHRYPDAAARRLKAALGERLGLDPSGIVVGNGSHELLLLLAMTLVCPGDNVVYSRHGFAVFPIAALQSGAEPREAPATDALGADPEAFLERIDARVKLVFLANPNNPTGTTWDRATLCRVLDALPPQTLFVLDEAYREYAAEDELPDGRELLDRYPQLVVTRTFSKAYGLAGLRLGYALCHPGLAALLERTRPSFNGNLLALAAAEAALADDAHLARVVAANREGKRALVQGLSGLGLNVHDSPGNFVLVDYGRLADPIEAALRERGILVRPMGGYGLPMHSRITVGLPEDHAALLAALAEILDR